MNLQPISARSPQYSSTVNFKSQIVQTKYMDDLLRECILKPQGKNKILENIRKILMDGKNNLVKIDYYKKGLLARLISGAYKITINDKASMWNCTFSGTGIVTQGKNALIDVLNHEEMALETPVPREKYKAPKLVELKEKYKQAWKSYIMDDEIASDNKKDKLQRKKLKFLEWRYNIELQKEFIKLRQELFPNSPIINPPKPQIERLADFDD